MLMILVTHAAFATGFTQRSWLGDYLARLDLAVPMFFVLSGFLLYRPYAQAQIVGRSPMATRRFYRRRVLRITPGYWVGLVGIVAAFSFISIADAWQWIANLFFLPAVGVDQPYAIGQAWSIGVEVTFYLLLPLYATATGRLAASSDPAHRHRNLLLAAVALYAAGEAFRVVVVLADPSWVEQSLLWLPMYLDLFALGMALAVWSVGDAVGMAPPRVFERAAEHPAACWMGAFAVFVLVAQMEPPPTPFGLAGAEYIPRQFAYGLASLLWLLPAIFGDQSRGRLRAFLVTRPLVYLGVISYSFYLWHLAFVEQAKRWTVPDYDSLVGLEVFTGNVVVVTVIAFVCTLVVASVIFHVVELPFLRLKDRPLRDLLVRQAAPAAGVRSND
jgi:peptidoglycan/LPS O-acetylase OafA/YrhL